MQCLFVCFVLVFVYQWFIGKVDYCLDWVDFGQCVDVVDVWLWGVVGLVGQYDGCVIVGQQLCVEVVVDEVGVIGNENLYGGYFWIVLLL